MRHLLLTLLFAASLASAQPAIGPPPAGYIRDFQHSLRPVIGLAGNFLLGDSIAEGVVSCAFSGTNGLVKTDSSVYVLNRQGQIAYAMDAVPGPALFAFAADGAPAFAYLTTTAALMVWTTDRFENASWQIGGTVLAIANPEAGVLAAIVQREDGLREQISLDAFTGNVISQNSLTHAYGPVFLTATGVVLSGGTTDAVIEQMDKDWVHLINPDSHKHYAIRLESGRPPRYQLRYQLPEAQP